MRMLFHLANYKRTILVATVAASLSPAFSETTATGTQPNILWITCEDYSPDFSFYGDTHSRTPNLDAFAKAGCVFTRAFAPSPVCAPSRSTIITGVYAATLGTHNMRTSVPLPPDIKPFPWYMRKAGYYCTNNWKTDYNFPIPDGTWDENGRQAHWRNRANSSQPFFSVFNFNVTHEGKFKMPDKEYERLIKDVEPKQRVQPDDVKPPPYFPDTPVTRKDWARHYNLAMQLDIEVGNILQQLKEDGLSTNTIIFFFSDHGVGMPRSKRWLYDAGLQVPLIVKWDGVTTPGSVNQELVSLLDMAPTMMSITGLEIPSYMQGRVFIGPDKQPEPQYVFGTRDRVDEADEYSRSVRDRQFKYIRNFQPERPYAQASMYADGNPTMQEMRRMHADGTLTGPATLLFQPQKPAEELYDTAADPHEINNLASDPQYKEKLEAMRAELIRWQEEIDDKGRQPEPEHEKRQAARERRKKRGE